MPSTGSIALAPAALDALTALAHARDGRPVTGVDRDTLRQWPGWGPLAPAFESVPEGRWADVADRLDELLTPQDLAAAADVCDTAFYTPAHLVHTIFGLLASMGLTGGRVLDLGCGHGRFISHGPEGFEWTGVEVDPTSAAIATLLHPDARIINKPLQKTTFRAGEFDAVVGNVPFSSARVFDPVYDAVGQLHDYFLIRALDAVRPGGYVAAITSRFTLDSTAGLSRLIRETGDLRAAIRLPTGAFAADGTNVVADIVVFQRRQPDAEPSGWDDRSENTDHYTVGHGRWEEHRERPRRHVITSHINPSKQAARPVEVNRYWEVHPDHVAGAMRVNDHHRNPLTVVADNPHAAIATAARAAATHLEPTPPRTGVTALDDVALEDPHGRKEGSFHSGDAGGIVRIVDGEAKPVRATTELRALIALRDAAAALLADEADQTRPDHHIAPTREHAHRLYRNYVDRWGPLNRGTLHEGKLDPDTGVPALTWRRPAMGGFRRDPDYVTVLALETYDLDTGEAEPAPVLLRRINRPPAPVERVDTAGEALSVTLGEGRGIDLDRIGDLLGLPPDGDAATREAAVVDALGDLVYADPARKNRPSGWVTAREYLSGNVRAKLDSARRAAASDSTYARNVTALEQALPADLTEQDIRVSLGAPWLTARDIEAFLSEVLGQRCSVTHTPLVAYWELDRRWVRASPDAAHAYGTSRIDPYALVEHGLNGKSPVIYDEEYDRTTRTTTRVRNNAETMAAVDKLAALSDRFSTWVWEDEDRAKRLVREYNDRFNSHVTRRHDGSRLTFPGLADGIDLWPWQRDIVDRITSSARTLCGHAVGAGKTRSMIAAAVTLRRFGLAQKPMIVVPNHLLEQIAREAQQTYPLGKFLIASKEDLSGDQRRLFAARCATGDWDAVVMTHQAFTSLPVDPTVESDWLETQRAELREHMQTSGSTSGRGAKQIARLLRTFESRLASLRHNTADPNTVRFDQLGIDFLAVDECQAFKRLHLGPTRSEGFSLGSSKRATDLLLKIETLAMRNPDRPHVAFFTGTPWSNTLAETYVWQRYLQPDRLADAGVAHFDAWAAAFVRYETRVEVTPDGGGFRLHRRPSVIQNAAELFAGMFAHVADLLPADAIDLDRPDMTTHNVTVEPTPTQRTYVLGLSERADRIRNGGDGADNMLVVCSDGRKAALDPRLVGLLDESPKVAAVADKVAAIYKANRDRTYGTHPQPGALQLLLCDLGTPHPGNTQTYGRLRAALAARGVPAEKVRWVHEAKTDKARAALFAACRDGQVAALIGSSEKVGIGTNIQTRLRAIHHVDAPWRPSDLEQRDGRGNRPGNLNATVDSYRYVVTGTFDAYMWQTLERKARFIAQAYRADGAVREIEDLGDMVLSYGEMKALATGNPHLLEQAGLAAEAKRLRTLRAVHTQSVNAAARRAEVGRATADRHRRVLDALVVAEMEAEANSASIDPAAAIEGLAAAVQRRRWSRVQWRGFIVGVSHTDSLAHSQRRNRGPLNLTFEADDVIVDSIELPRKLMRQPLAEIADTLNAAAEQWRATIPAQQRQLKRRAAAAEKDAAEAEQVAATAEFPHAAALADCERRLAAITAEIEAEASSRAA